MRLHFDPFYHSRANDPSSIKAIRGAVLGVLLGAFLWSAVVAAVWTVCALSVPHRPLSTSNPCLIAPDDLLLACSRRRQ